MSTFGYALGLAVRYALLAVVVVALLVGMSSVAYRIGCRLRGFMAFVVGRIAGHSVSYREALDRYMPRD